MIRMTSVTHKVDTIREDTCQLLIGEDSHEVGLQNILDRRISILNSKKEAGKIHSHCNTLDIHSYSIDHKLHNRRRPYV